MRAIGRTPFRTPSKHDYIRLFASTHAGGGLNQIRIYRKRGGGILSGLLSLGRRVLPYLGKFIAPVAMDFTRGVASDIIEGKTNLRKSLKDRGITGLKEVGKKIVRGGGKGGRIRKQKRKIKQKKNKNKKKNVKKREIYLT